MAKRSFRSSRNTATKASVYYSGSIIGAKISDTTDDVITKHTPIQTVPTLVFHDSGTKVLIDYSSANRKEIEIIKNFFNKVSVGTSFSIESGTASYLKERKNKIESDLSGSFTFLSYKNNVISANVTSVTNKDPFTDTYGSKYFTTTPRLSKIDENATGRYLYQIRNYSGVDSEYSFKNARPILPGDIIELSTPLNNGRFAITNYDTEDGVEIITVDSKLKEEDLVGTLITVNFFRSNFNENTLSSTEKKIIKSIRDDSQKSVRGSCCLYTKEKKEDTETGHIFDEGDLYSCGCKYDWECVQLARATNSSLSFDKNNSFCKDLYNDSCCGQKVFRNSPDEDSNERCQCCSMSSNRETLVVDPDNSAQSVRSMQGITEEDVSTFRDLETAGFNDYQGPTITAPLDQNSDGNNSTSGASAVSRKSENVYFNKRLDKVFLVSSKDKKINLSGSGPFYSGRVYRFDQSDPSNRNQRITFSIKNTYQSTFSTGIQVSKNGTPGEPGSYTDLYLGNLFKGNTIYLVSITDNFDSLPITVLGYSPINQRQIFEAKSSARREPTEVVNTPVDYTAKLKPNQQGYEPTSFNITVKRIEEEE